MADQHEPDPVSYNALKTAEPTLPFAWYHDPAHHAREMAAIWQRAWVYVCRADALEPLDYRTVKIGSQNVIILRDADGTMRAYHNACRHRGSILCTNATGRLGSRLLVCPYHQWSYAADNGRLVGTTSFTEPDGFDRASLGLFPVALAVWRGCVLVNLDPGATFDPATDFQRPPDNLVHFPLEDMVTGYHWQSEIACNWKTFWENVNECLHCPNVHPELVQLVPMFTRRIIHPHDVPDWPDHTTRDDPKYRGGMKAGAQTWSTDHSAQGRVISTLTPDDLARGHNYASAWPTFIVAGYPDHVRIIHITPIGPERLRLTAEWLFPAETLADPSYDPKKVIDFAVLVMEQDARACELNQLGMHATPLKQGVLMPEEYVLKRFQDWVRARLDALDAPGHD